MMLQPASAKLTAQSPKHRQKHPVKPAPTANLSLVPRFGDGNSDTLSLRVKATPDSEVSNTFLTKINEGLKSVPEVVLKSLNAANWNVQVSKFLTDALPDMKGMRPRGGDEWITAEHRSGVTIAPIIYLSEYQWCMPPKEPSKLTNSKLFPALRKVKPPVESPFGYLCRKVAPDRTLRHELGHALEILLRRIADTPEFIEAYERDLETMSPQERQEVYYFLQPDANGKPTQGGRREAIAEAFASLWGGGCNDTRHFTGMFPNVMEFAKAQVEQLEQRNGRLPSAWDKGPPVLRP
ncbi:MAG: hypothetical protein K0Q50_1071 [Vampirovibrio sp.]|jgi:hypothetical protein|nr:hypothetical protein [Vampirovibrio sp.]